MGSVYDIYCTNSKMLITELSILEYQNSELFKYRDKLIHDLAPICPNLTRPFRKVN